MPEPQGPTTRSEALSEPERELFEASPGYRKVGIVHARQVKHDGSVQTPEGVMAYRSGDYIVSDDPPTHLWPVRRDIFERTYQPAEARAAAPPDIANPWTDRDLLDIFDRTADRPAIRATIHRLLSPDATRQEPSGE